MLANIFLTASAIIFVILFFKFLFAILSKSLRILRSPSIIWLSIRAFRSAYLISLICSKISCIILVIKFPNCWYLLIFLNTSFTVSTSSYSNSGYLSRLLNTYSTAFKIPFKRISKSINCQYWLSFQVSSTLAYISVPIYLSVTISSSFV
jgi:hypothetical protein